jgi:hypothetical protein
MPKMLSADGKVEEIEGKKSASSATDGALLAD